MTRRTTLALASCAVGLFFAHALAFAFLCDDAYISFRYARNLVEGHGLVFNPGERVEGYTNFLWTLQLAGLWWAFGWSPEHTAMPLGLLSSAGTLLALGLLARTSPFGPRRALIGTLWLAALHRSLAVWATSGLEQRQVTLMLLLAVFALHRGVRADRPLWRLAASALFGLAILSRPEPLLLTASAGAWVLWEARRNGLDTRSATTRLLQVGLPAAAVALAQLGFRLSYYGAPLPNTYYAKGEGIWLAGGLAYFAQAALEHGWYLLLPLGLIGLRRRLERGDSLHVLSLFLVVPVSLYYLKIGGDHFEYRALDLHFCLLLLAVVDGLLVLWERLSQLRFRLLLLATVLYTNLLPVIDGLNSLEADRNEPQFAWFEPTFDWVTPWALVPGYHPLSFGFDNLRRYTRGHLIATRQVEHDAFCRTERLDWGPYLTRRERMPTGLVAAKGAMGVAPFMTPDVVWIDRFGLVDATVARMPEDPTAVRQAAHPRKYPAELKAYVDGRATVRLLHAETGHSPDLPHSLALDLGDGVWMPFQPSGPLPPSIAGRPLYATSPRRPGVQIIGAEATWEVRGRLQPSELERIELASDEAIGLRIGQGRIRTVELTAQGSRRTLSSETPTYVVLRGPGPLALHLPTHLQRDLVGHRLRHTGDLPRP